MNENIITYKAEPGEHIRETAQNMVAMAMTKGCAVRSSFNEIPLEAMPGSYSKDVVKSFEEQSEKRRVDYENSEAGKAARLEAQQRCAKLQAEHDALMVELKTLDFTNDVAVLDWLCRYQNPSDHTGVDGKQKEVVDTFTAHGFQAGVNCGPHYKADDRDNAFRYMVGQCLSCLTSIGAIHGIIHTHAEKWRVKFL